MNKILVSILLGCVMPIIAAPAWAGFQEGADAYKNGDYQTALNEWLPLAQSGDAQAQNAVGALYDNGLGVSSDEAEAFRWYSLAADQNYPLAMRNLGTMYATGHGTPYSLPQAQLWLGRAAAAGDAMAAKRLAALPPVATAPADPVVTPLSPTSSAVGTSTLSGGTSGSFGSVTGPSNLFARPAPSTVATLQPSGEPVAPTATPVQPVATSTLDQAGGGTQQSGAGTSDQSTANQPVVDATPTAAIPAPDAATPPAATMSAAETSTSPIANPAVSPGSVASTNPPTATATVGDGWHAFDMGDYKTALEIWQPLAEGGDINLQVLIGSLYDYGQGVVQNKAEALKWYLMAARQGSGRGQYAAGALLAKDAKQRNLVESYKWLTIASQTLKEQGGDVAANQALTLRQQILTEMSKDDVAKAEALVQSFHAG